MPEENQPGVSVRPASEKVKDRLLERYWKALDVYEQNKQDAYRGIRPDNNQRAEFMSVVDALIMELRPKLMNHIQEAKEGKVEKYPGLVQAYKTGTLESADFAYQALLEAGEFIEALGLIRITGITATSEHDIITGKARLPK